MFIQPRCPFCVKALRYIEEAKAENPELRDVEIEVHDELKEPAFADTFDYYYVPTFFVDGKKRHEGGIFKPEIIELLKETL